MRMITRRPMVKSILTLRNKLNYLKLIITGALVELVHYVIVSNFLNIFAPVFNVFENPQSVISGILNLCLISYPIILGSSILKARKEYKRGLVEANKVIEEITEDMQLMGFDISKENIVNADLEFEKISSNYTNKGVEKYNQVLIQITDKKSQLLVLRECCKMLQEFAYIEAESEITVQLLDEKTRSRQLTK